MKDFRYIFDQLRGLTIQVPETATKLISIDGGPSIDDRQITELNIHYDDAYRMIIDLADNLNLIDNQKQKFKKLLEFLIEVL